MLDVTLSAGIYTLGQGDGGELALRRADETAALIRFEVRSALVAS